MLTPWGELPLADAHVHFFSHRFFALLAQQKQIDLETLFGILGWHRPPEDPVALADAWVAELDRHGVRKAMLIASLPQDAVSVASAVQAHPLRFSGAAMVNPLDATAGPSLAPLFENRSLTTVCLFPAMHGYALESEVVRNLIRTLPSHSRYFVHCGTLSVGVRNKLGLPSAFPVQNPLELRGIALEFADRRFVVPHFGSGLWRETLALARECSNVHLDTSSSNSWMSTQTPPVTLATVLAETLEVLGPERLLFGTDSSFFPRGWNAAVAQSQIQALQEIGADARTARYLLVDNFDTFCEM